MARNIRADALLSNYRNLRRLHWDGLSLWRARELCWAWVAADVHSCYCEVHHSGAGMKFWEKTAFAALVSLAVGSSAFAAEPTPALKQKFQETIASSKMSIVVKDGRLIGPGSDYLKSKAQAAHFFLIGEEHGVADIADTVRFLFDDLNQAGYRHFAIEVDPYMTEKVEVLLRRGGTKALAQWLASDETKLSLPFYSWSAEAKLAHRVVAAKESPAPALWGLDQVFIGAFGHLLREMSLNASHVEAKALAGKLADQARGDLEFVGKLELARLEELKSLMNPSADGRFVRLIDDMILSARIYAPFVGRAGLSVYAANLERENLMKRTFLSRYVAAGKPKVIFKFGGNHMMQGLSLTHVPSLGNFVSDFAASEGKRTFHLMVLCGPETKAGDFMGNPADCDYSIDKHFPELVGHVDATQPTLIDLAPWKEKPVRWAHLSEEVRGLIWAYDAILFVPNGKPARALK